MSIVSKRVRAADASFKPVNDFYFRSRYGARRGNLGICDFTFGNPHEMPLEQLVSSVRDRAIPLDQNWYAYKTSEIKPQEFVADRLSQEFGIPFEPQDIALTAGAFAAIMIAFRLILDAGDEAVFSEPAWFCYKPMLLAADCVPVAVHLKEPGFGLNLEAIDAAIGPRTKLVIVNSPHNPTGRIYDRSELEALADMLERASKRVGHRIYLLSDEPYRKLRFDNHAFVSPAAIYPWTLISYSYGKVLLAPGQRLGYLAISPLMPAAEREDLQSVMFAAQMSMGWCFPSALMQHALPDLEDLTIDEIALVRRRDALMHVLTKAGCRVLSPEGTFYLWSRWPDGDPESYWDKLADHDVFVMPGTIMNTENYFRICLTASDAMVEKSLPAFEAMGS